MLKFLFKENLEICMHKYVRLTKWMRSVLLFFCIFFSFCAMTGTVCVYVSVHMDGECACFINVHVYIYHFHSYHWYKYICLYRSLSLVHIEFLVVFSFECIISPILYSYGYFACFICTLMLKRKRCRWLSKWVEGAGSSNCEV